MNKKWYHWYTLFSLLYLLSGCETTSNQTKKKKVVAIKAGLKKRVQEFNRSLRWKRYFSAKSFVLPKKQRAYFLKWEDERETRNIVSLTIRNLQFPSPERAEVWVEIKDYKLPSVTVRRKFWIQTWKWYNAQWYLEKEEILKREKKKKPTKPSPSPRKKIPDLD